MNKTDLKEQLIMIGVFSGILFPLRLLFNEYLTHYWIGTFGLTASVVFSVFYLSNKGKLGWIGKIIINRIKKRSQKKSFKFLIGVSIFLIYYSSIIIIGIHNPDPQLTVIAKKELDDRNIKNTKQMLDYSFKNIKPTDLIYSFYIFIPLPLTFTVHYLLNELSSGFYLALFTVVLVEEIELLAILLYFRYTLKPELSFERNS